MMEIVVGTKVYEAPMMTGNLVPNNVCSNVLIPVTNSNVEITFAFSSYFNQGSILIVLKIYSNCRQNVQT